MIPAHLIGALGCERDICRNPACPEAVKVRPETGRWFITMGHPGFNTPANNRDGYKTRKAAEATVRRYGGAKSPRLY